MSKLERLIEAQMVVDEQAEDAGLWFIAETVTESYLQQALRRLHAVIEGTQQSIGDSVGR